MKFNKGTKVVHSLIRNGYECLNPCYVDNTARGLIESYQLLKASEMPDYFCDDEPKLISIISEEGQAIIDRYLESPNVRIFPDPLENGNSIVKSKNQSHVL
jgi:hypothetical protein